MELTGLMGEAFKVFLGSPDIMSTLLTWAVIVTLTLTIIEVFKETKL
jgi:hypothetical protein